ncbi:MAG: ABC transporter permease [Armatimonadota bacterium]|nr:ABC transporter permease [Armatimonadota bacterium]
MSAAPEAVPRPVAARDRAPRRRVWVRFLRHRGARAGGAALAALALIAAAAPWIAPGDPAAMGEDRFLEAPGPGHWFGTDDLGRDVLTRVVHGGRISLVVGLVAVGVAAVAGAAIGLVTGYYGGRLDNVVMRGMDLLMAFPGVLLALLVIAILGRGLVNVMIAVGIADIPAFVRLVRGSVLGAREHVYVEAARAVGVPDRLILLRHMLPNVFAPLLVVSTLEVGNAILVASSLSFLGLGAQPPSPEWGAMLAAGREYMRTAWWLTVFPGLAIAFTVLAVNLLGDGLRDAIDPKLSRA